ncbi:MAG: M20/M25/M40 family metallo-hydrolase [Hyphomicrobiales bacterium]|nr:M20/M25/M40 family metallo-hydrolase [Hyphomicrobiales bacterium]
MVETSRIVEWLQRLVRIPSVGPRNAGPRSGAIDEGRIAAQVAAWFEALGGEVEREDVYPGRPNTYGSWRGQSDRWIAVDVHVDTVGVETMIGDPFDGRLENGRVYGRGAVDTKASLGVVLALLEDMRRRGGVLKPNLVVCASSDEETGCGGAPVFARWVRRRGLTLDQLLVAEPTMCAPIYGHKGSSNVMFEIQGEAAHSSTPHLGQNAIVAAAPLIAALAAEHERVSRLEPSTDVGAPTLTVAKISGGQALNVVPDKCQIYVNRRVVPGEEPAAISAALEAYARQHCPLPLTMTIVNELPAFYQPPDTPWIRQLSGWSGMAAATAPFGTNASAYSGLAREVAVFGPGSIDQAHRDIEWIDVAELEKVAGVYARWLDID